MDVEVSAFDARRVWSIALSGDRSWAKSASTTLFDALVLAPLSLEHPSCCRFLIARPIACAPVHTRVWLRARREETEMGQEEEERTGYVVQMDGFSVLNLQTREQLVEFRRAYGVRDSWHEPDDQDVGAFPAIGHGFDNASCNPSHFDVTYARRQDDGGIYAEVFSVLPVDRCAEHGVFLFHAGEPVAFVNLALLLAMACGYEGF